MGRRWSCNATSATPAANPHCITPNLDAFGGIRPGHKKNAHPASTPNIINDNCNEIIANLFCYGAFADRHSGVAYNNLTGNFPFISFNGSICYLVMYVYKPNAILATPIAGLDDTSIYNA